MRLPRPWSSHHRQEYRDESNKQAALKRDRPDDFELEYNALDQISSVYDRYDDQHKINNRKYTTESEYT